MNLPIDFLQSPEYFPVFMIWISGYVFTYSVFRKTQAWKDFDSTMKLIVTLIVGFARAVGKSIITSIRLDKEVLKEAKELGLNMSKISENALRKAINAMKEANLGPDSDDSTSKIPKSPTPTTYNATGSENRRWGCGDLNSSHESPSLVA